MLGLEWRWWRAETLRGRLAGYEEKAVVVAWRGVAREFRKNLEASSSFLAAVPFGLSSAPRGGSGGEGGVEKGRERVAASALVGAAAG